MSREFLGKPKGITLLNHTKNVIEEAKKIISSHPLIFKKYFEFLGTELNNRLLASTLYHDDGKKHIKWQNACWQEYNEHLKTGKISGAYLKKTGIRHEMESLKMHVNDERQFSNVIKIAIAAHHGKLSKRFEERWETDENGSYREIWNQFIKISMALFFPITHDTFRKAVISNYEYSGPRFYLQLADHRASIFEENKPIPQFNKFEYRFNSLWKKRPVQILAEDHWQEDLLLLRAPTGSGKTDACLLWAKQQILNGKADRLVIAMPTRFTSNALAISVADSLSETGLYHSSAWFVRHFNNSKESLEAEHFAKLVHEFSRLLETPITVCTIDHLLISQTHSREDHHGITFNLAHSCLVIDEADFYDEFTQANILELLKVLKILKVPVLLMSASLPQSTLELYKKTGYNPKDIIEDISDNTRIRCRINSKVKYENVEELQDILEKSTLQPTIIYANTVAKAMAFYNWFAIRDLKPVLYHSRFTEPDKALKEEILIDSLGKNAWYKNAAKGIAILTQIGEMSVNISADYMISDICPIDRLVQRIGRLSRFNKQIGSLEILFPYKKGKIYPAPYGQYIPQKGWEISKYLDATIQLLQCKEYNAFDFVNLVNDIYKELPIFSNRSQLNAQKFVDQIIQNWLIVPLAQVKEDEESTHIWKSRDIENQIDIYVLDPYDYLESNIQLFKSLEKNKNKSCYFNNYKEFMFYKNQYAVSCPLYLLKKGVKNAKVYKRENIWIGDNKESVSVWCTNSYNKELGLILEDSDNFYLS